MKIKNILYVASFMAFAGINAAEQEPQIAAQEVRTTETVLQEFALLHPAPSAAQKSIFSRAGDNLHIAGVYGYHIIKYPFVASTFCLPFIMKCKNELFYNVWDSFKLSVCSATLGAATIVGVFYGPRWARKQFEDERIVSDAPINLARLNAVAAKVAELENLHGVLGQVQTNLDGLTAGCNLALSQLNELQVTAENAQRQLADANAQLDDVVARGQRAQAEALARSIQYALRDMYAMRRVFESIEDIHHTGVDVSDRLRRANSEFEGMQLCQELISQISSDTFRLDLSPRYQEMFQRLRTDIQPLLAEQVTLRLEMRAIGQQLLPAPQQEERGHRQGLLALGSAATNSVHSVAVQEVPRGRQQQQVQNIGLHPMAVQNFFGSGGPTTRSLSFSGQLRPVTHPVPAPTSETVVVVDGVDVNEGVLVVGAASGYKMEDVD